MLMNNKRIEKVIRHLEQKGYNLSLAQWIEQRPSKPWVGSSNLSGEANRFLGVDKPTFRSYTKDNKRVRAAEFPSKSRRQTLPMPVIPVEIFLPKEVDL